MAMKRSHDGFAQLVVAKVLRVCWKVGIVTVIANIFNVIARSVSDKAISQRYKSKQINSQISPLGIHLLNERNFLFPRTAFNLLFSHNRRLRIVKNFVINQLMRIILRSEAGAQLELVFKDPVPQATAYSGVKDSVMRIGIDVHAILLFSDHTIDLSSRASPRRVWRSHKRLNVRDCEIASSSRLAGLLAMTL